MSYDRILEILTQSLPASPGQRQKSDRLFFTEENWEYDPLVSTGYLYDFLHDSQPEQNRNLSPASDPLKTPVEVRVSVPSEGSAPALRITFRPSHTCPADYWESLAALSGAEYPWDFILTCRNRTVLIPAGFFALAFPVKKQSPARPILATTGCNGWQGNWNPCGRTWSRQNPFFRSPHRRTILLSGGNPGNLASFS